MPDDKLFQATTGRAAESTHWYNRQGQAVYEVPSADGRKMVTPDIRHARKMNLVPGVTAVIGCAARPQLTIWLMKQAVMAALTLTRRPHEPEPEYLSRVIDDANEQSKQAADEGTRIHTAIECYYSGRDYDPKYQLHVMGVVDCLNRSYGADTEWIAEESFACPLGFGSKIDLRARNKRIIVDIKGKDFVEPPGKGERMAYDEHCMQLAAYDTAKGDSHACANLFVSRNAPGLCHLHQWDATELNRGWEMFAAMLSYWQVKNKYVSAWGS